MTTFGTEYMCVKHTIAEMNETYEANPISLATYCNQIRNTWIPLVYAFIQKWNKEMVIQDVRIALNNVEEELGLIRTSWPPFRSS